MIASGAARRLRAARRGLCRAADPSFVRLQHIRVDKAQLAQQVLKYSKRQFVFSSQTGNGNENDSAMRYNVELESTPKNAPSPPLPSRRWEARRCRAVPAVPGCPGYIWRAEMNLPVWDTIPFSTVLDSPAGPGSLGCSRRAGVSLLGWDKLPISHSLEEIRVIH